MRHPYVADVLSSYWELAMQDVLARIGPKLLELQRSGLQESFDRRSR